jgi:hypothetical protein
MSLQLRVRFYENSPEANYETSLVSRCFDLFDGIKESIASENFLAAPYTSNEEELYDLIEEELGGEPDDDGLEEFEETIEKELALRGEFFPVSELLRYVSAFQKYFESNSEESFDLGSNRKAEGKAIAEDLQHLQKELERGKDRKARFAAN